MRRAIELAQNAEGFTSPNPLVGAVLVAHGRIIGEGYHHCAGMPHAEVIAINSVRDRALLRESTLYVSLEPCSHYGKTPPCAELILREGIPHVVVAMLDPFPSVSGRGIKMLREAGVSVQVGLLAGEAEELNRHFLTAQRQHRPYVTLKWAESSDGFIDALRDDASTPPVRLSTPLTTRFVHHRRMIHDAILVGFRTALLDNPSLTVRHWYGRNPLRVVTDRHLALPRHLTLCAHTGLYRKRTTLRLSLLRLFRSDRSLPPSRGADAGRTARSRHTVAVSGGGCLYTPIFHRQRSVR